MSNHIRQTITFDAKPPVIYSMLMDSRKHAAFTGAPAKIGKRAGDRVSAHGGYIAAYQVELVKNKRIVQAWRGADWPKGAWSIATFEFKTARGGRTKLTFTQHGVPPKLVEHFKQGWYESYWDAIKAMLARKR
jgi:activator of HSP90 ATPase